MVTQQFLARSEQVEKSSSHANKPIHWWFPRVLNDNSSDWNFAYKKDIPSILKQEVITLTQVYLPIIYYDNWSKIS